MSAVDPAQLVGIADNDALDSIATDVQERFERVLESVGDGSGVRRTPEDQFRSFLTG
ncbi:hypothetical protein ACFQL4_02680 [Halosimplex aquaticum]